MKAHDAGSLSGNGADDYFIFETLAELRIVASLLDNRVRLLTQYMNLLGFAKVAQLRSCYDSSLFVERETPFQYRRPAPISM